MPLSRSASMPNITGVHSYPNFSEPTAPSASTATPEQVSQILKHSGVSYDTEKRVNDFMATLVFAKSFENRRYDPITGNDPFSRLIHQASDGALLGAELIQLVGFEQAQQIAPQLEQLLQDAAPDDWREFPLADKLSQIRMGQPESWPREAVEVLLRSRNLEHADLSGAPLRHVNLSGLNLAGADLSNADLVSTNLADTNLNGATLQGANCVGPLISAYGHLQKSPDSFYNLLHPLVEKFATCKSLLANPSSRTIFQKGALLEYSKACQWNLLPPMKRETANFLVENLLHCSNHPDWLLNHQDLIAQLLHEADRIGLDPSLRNSLWERVYAEPKLKPLHQKLGHQSGAHSHYFGIDARTGEPQAIPAHVCGQCYERLRPTPNFGPQHLKDAYKAVSPDFFKDFKYTLIGMLSSLFMFSLF